MEVHGLREALAKVRCFLLDMDGTFYLGDKLLPGSLDFLDKLRDTNRSALFVTNNSSKSARVYEEKLKRMGVREPFLNVLTSGQAAGHYALEHFPGQKAFVLGNEMLREELSGMGLSLEDEHPEYVILGYDTTLTYAKMTRVCDFLRAGLPYIATHPDKNCPTETGFAPDIGAIIAFIQVSTQREPDVILGKPYGGIVRDALARTGMAPGELAMVGDRLYTDIATGLNFGLTSLLVLTGETLRDDLQNSDIQPDFVVDRLASLIEYM